MTSQPFVSALARTECRRAFLRANGDGRVGVRAVSRASGRLDTFVRASAVVPVDPELLERAGERFPLEPVRTLDAIHLAALERIRGVAADLAVVSLDERVRANAAAMGFAIVP